MSGETISLKSSPLVQTLTGLYRDFPGIGSEDINLILIESKFDSDSTRNRLEGMVHPVDPPKTDAEELGRWYEHIDPMTGLSNPHREMRVYKFDPDVPDNSPN